MATARRDIRQAPPGWQVSPVTGPITAAECPQREIRRMERALGFPPGYARSERARREIEDEYEELALRRMLD